MIEYVLVAFMMSIDKPGYEIRPLVVYYTLEECQRSLDRAKRNGTTKIVNLMCTTRNTNATEEEEEEEQ